MKLKCKVRESYWNYPQKEDGTYDIRETGRDAFDLSSRVTRAELHRLWFNRDGEFDRASKVANNIDHAKKYLRAIVKDLYAIANGFGNYDKRSRKLADMYADVILLNITRTR